MSDDCVAQEREGSKGNGSDHMVATAKPDAVTLRALFRGRHFKSAARATRTRVVPGWWEAQPYVMGDPTEGPKQIWITTPDLALADQLDLEIKLFSIAATKRRPAHTEHRIIVPPGLMRNSGALGERGKKAGGSKLFVAARSLVEVTYGDCGRWSVSGAPPDEVVESCLPGGRIIYIEPWLTRVVARQWLRVVGPRAEAVMHPCSHAYRAERSVRTAFEGYRRWAKTHRFVVAKDISGFYAATKLELADHVLKVMLPGLSPELRDFGLWLQTARVLRRPSHPARENGRGRMSIDAPGHLLAGTVTAPLISNLVADFLLGWPLQESMGGDVVLVRYADDVLIMAVTAQAAERAVREIGRLLAPEDMHLNPDKGLMVPVDVTKTPVTWLGKELHGRSVRTPDDVVGAYIGELLELDPASVEFRRLVHTVRSDLALDGDRRVDYLVRRVRDVSRHHADAFAQVGKPPLPGPYAPEEDQQAAQAAIEETS